MKITILGALCLIGSGVNAFAPPMQHQSLSVVNRGSSALNVNVPRVELPDAVASQLADLDLQNPNTMNDAEYRSSAGAAIAGTLLFFLLPGALISGIFSNLGPVAIAVFIDFAFSALIGGGLLIFLSLRGDAIGETVREYGYKAVAALNDVGVGVPRYDLPSSVTDVMTGELGLANPNSLSEEDYFGFAGAAIVGTLVFFLLPGALVTGASDTLLQFAGSAAVNLVFSSLFGGVGSAYLALRGDSIGSTVKEYGGKLLDLVDDVAGGDGPNLPFSS